MNTKRRQGEGDAAFFIRNVLMASSAAMIAETATIPMDTAKVRMQLQKVEPGKAPRYNGLMGTTKTIVAEEGALALWNGLTPGL
jgi:solute carrier family 25 uncoupling protein 8/9